MTPIDKGPVRFGEVSVHTNVALDRSEAAISIISELEAGAPTAAVIAAEITQSGFPVASVEDPITLFPKGTSLVQSAAIPRPQLWYPNGGGASPLYQARLAIRARDGGIVDRAAKEFGIRDVAAGPGGEISVNGRRVWVQGWSWNAGMAPERYDRVLALARDSGANLLNVTGGVETEAFYDLCDRFGLMVWQEVRSPGDIQPRLLSHPSLIAWGTPVNEPALAEELRTAAQLEDPQRLWLPAGAAPFAEAEGPHADHTARHGEIMHALGVQRAIETARGQQDRVPGVMAGRLPASGRPTPVYYAAKRAYRPFHVSASFRTVSWAGEAVFSSEVWLHNHSVPRPLLNAVATVLDLQGRELYQENLAGEGSENSSECIGDLYWRFPGGFAAPFVLMLEVIDEEGETVARNAYQHSRAPEPAFVPLIEAPSTTLEVERCGAGVSIRNTGTALALGIQVKAERALIEDSDFPLPPGAQREIRLSDPAAPVDVRAWNAAAAPGGLLEP